MLTRSIVHGSPSFGLIIVIRWMSSRVCAIQPLKHTARLSAPSIWLIHMALTSDPINRLDGQKISLSPLR